MGGILFFYCSSYGVQTFKFAQDLVHVCLAAEHSVFSHSHGLIDRTMLRLVAVNQMELQKLPIHVEFHMQSFSMDMLI